MTSSSDPYLVDVLLSLHSSTERVIRIAEGKTFDEFLGSELMQLATAKAVEWTGELSGRILRKWPDVVTRYPEIPFGPAYATRNRLSHGYDTLDFEALWRVVTISIPLMEKQLRDLLATLDDQP